MQDEPGVTVQLIQFSDMGEHCRRLARKNATVHAVVKPIMTHEMMENVLEVNILARTSANPTTIFEMGKPCYSPSIEKDYSGFCKAKGDILC